MKHASTRLVARAKKTSFGPRFSKKCLDCKQLIVAGSIKELLEHNCGLQKPSDLPTESSMIRLSS